MGFPELAFIGFALWFAFWAVYHGIRAVLRRRGQRLARELGLLVSGRDGPARRGGEVEAVVTISDTGELGNVDVGLVCTESYDEEEQSAGGRSSYRTTSHATAHETWVPVERMVGTQTVRLAIPSEAPFSYAGGCLSFRWEVVVRGRRAGGVDAEARSELSVLP